MKGKPTAGYKVSLTSKETQDMFDADSPLYGQQVAERFLQSPADVDLQMLNEPLLEVELTFRAKEDLQPSDTLEDFWFLASDNPNYNTRGVLKDPKWNISTDFFDRRIKYVPNIDKIIDYIFEHNLFNVVIEFAVYPERVGKKNEFVAIFELRTHY